MDYQVFISYRRSTGDTLAQLLYYRFSSDGYKVFFDVETMRSGKFNQQIYTKIDECKDFVLVLSENALDRCAEEADWVRLEIEYALHKKKNIILVLGRNFTFPTDLPESIDEIRFFQGVTANSEFFDQVIKKLEDLFVSKLQATGVERNTEYDTSEYMNILNSLFDSTVSYRDAMNRNEKENSTIALSNMSDLLKTLYNLCEKEQYISSKKLIIQQCTEIVDHFNSFILHYKAFLNSSNGNSKKTQESEESARCAEVEFKMFVDRISFTLAQR